MSALDDAIARWPELEQLRTWQGWTWEYPRDDRLVGTCGDAGVLRDHLSYGDPDGRTLVCAWMRFADGYRLLGHAGGSLDKVLDVYRAAPAFDELERRP
ncbi:hypothetical protein BC739_001174 [Kutzneria viridogrisea]|uniref:Uncharacterized protein n=1 Tax=Kutzneria viridogrisea TaxID=47990 RepID=A0ABR6BB89_9PSEU|nr:hypothetical protein [Kutzneria viridogrisea]